MTTTLLLLAAIPPTLFALHRLALWLEARGWLYYREKQPQRRSGSALGPLAELIDPSVKMVHVVQENADCDDAKGKGGDGGPPPIFKTSAGP